MNVLKKSMAVFLSLLMVAGALSVSVYAIAETDDFTITDPYKDINWDTWEAYKTQLHCHTNASDGYLTIAESVQKHYDLDYDIVSITDHGTLNQGWNKEPELIPLVRLIKKERTKLADIIPLSDAEYKAYIDGTATSSTRTHTNGMLDVPLGIELNMATPVADCHLTGYFSDYGQGLAGVFGDYETPSKGVADAGGISMLAHVGEYVYTDKDSADHVGKPIDEYYVNKFARLFLDNKGSSVGMGINSATDAHTRCDRILYDQILQKTIPNGVIPWGFTFSDSHNDSSINDAYTMMYMPEFSLGSFRECMENGEFFSITHFSNGVELNGMAEMPGYNDDPETIDYMSNETPMVTRVTVDQENDTITIEGENFNMITWVSNGNVIKRETDVTGNTATIDLNASDLLDDPYMFVRFYLTGENGLCYSQPFVIEKNGESFEKVDVPETHDVSTFLRGLVTVVDWIFFKLSPVIWAFKYFALGYNPLERLFKF